ncbi:MAG: 16S rRNA (uracil(1498)-N(3))-methyltransferase [Caldilineaceae bacterium]|nr:16S rRNA (uracil(1498)-N(3))-methyltransferase [Caldilineaceae bacterium]
MQRFFMPALLPAVGEIISLGPLHHQLRSVLRAQPGTQFLLLDNQGGERLMEVVSVERRDTTARVAEVRPAAPEPAVAVTLYQCVLKLDKLEWVWQKATELGVTTLVPVISRRTVARAGRTLQAKQARWEAIVREAAEQCGRGGLPVIAPSVSLAEAFTSAPGTRLLPWEEAGGNPGLLHALAQAAQPIDAVSLLIGPEGGLEAGEVEQARADGWQVVSLGQRILRAETAAVATITVVRAALGDLGDAASVKVGASAEAIQNNGNPRDSDAADAGDKVKGGEPDSVGSTTVNSV